MTHDAKQNAQEAADNMAARAKFLESLKADQRKALEKCFAQYGVQWPPKK